jgi:hypothetical protein
MSKKDRRGLRKKSTDSSNSSSSSKPRKEDVKEKDHKEWLHELRPQPSSEEDLNLKMSKFETDILNNTPMLSNFVKS